MKKILSAISQQQKNANMNAQLRKKPLEIELAIPRLWRKR